jgi:hypothetical protein
MSKSQTARSGWLVSASALGLFVVATSSASATEIPTPAAGTDAAVPSDAAPGMRAYIDPATGKLRQPTAEERAAEGQAHAAAAKQRDAKAKQLKKVKMANGAVRLDTQGLFNEEVTATLNADGSLSYGFQTAGGDQVPHDAAAGKLEDK